MYPAIATFAAHKNQLISRFMYPRILPNVRSVVACFCFLSKTNTLFSTLYNLEGAEGLWQKVFDNLEEVR